MVTVEKLWTEPKRVTLEAARSCSVNVGKYEQRSQSDFQLQKHHRMFMSQPTFN